MPSPLPGTRTVAEFGSRFDADLAVARLENCGIEAVVLGDPAHAVAPHHVTDPVFAVVVRDEIVDDAMEILADGTDAEADELDQRFYLRRFADRPAWIRRTTVLLLITFAGPPFVAACYFAWVFLTGIGR